MKNSPITAFKYRDFRLFWIGSFISQMGDQMQIVAVAWQLYLLTHSPASLGLIGLSKFLPIATFSLVGGVIADKVDRKNLMIVCQAILSVVALILFAQTHFKLIAPWQIYFLLVLASIVTSFSLPARQSILPNLVPKKLFINAISLNTIQFQSATIAGPALAGFMIALSGVETIYLFNAISFILLIFALLPIKVPLNPKSNKLTLNLYSILEGLRFVKSSSIIFSTMILDFLATFLGTATILMPVFAKDVLRVGAQGLGFLYAAPAVGGVVAGLYFSSRHQIVHQGKIILGAVIFYGLSIIGFGLSKSLLLSLVFLSLMGAADMVSTILRNTIRQLMTPDYLRGRMSSVMMMFVQGGPQLGDMEAGFLASLVGAPITTVLGGVGAVLITLLISKNTPSLRKYQGHGLTV